MKKRILLLLLITLAVCVALIPTEAEAKVWDQGYYNGLFWYISGDEYYRPASQGGGYTLHVSRFDPFDGAPDNLKKQSWEKYKNDIVAASISSDVSEISYGTFANMPVLSRVSIPDNVLYVHNSAFANCPNLRSIALPRSLRGLGTEAFANTGITSINIPTSVNEIGLNPFYGCNISKIYYCGTAQQWNQISFVGDNDWADGVLSYHRWQDATCTKPKTCRYCNKTEGTPAAHTWQDATCTQPKQCACGATEGEPLGHAYQGEVYIAATCSAKGQMKYKCTRCSSGTYFEAIEKLPHTYGEWKPQTSVAGHYHTCTVCGEGESGQCKFGEWVIIKEPSSCKELGEKNRSCTLCGKKEKTWISHPHGECKWVPDGSIHKSVCTICNQNTGETEKHT